jgi:replication factor C subunit 3/5
MTQTDDMELENQPVFPAKEKGKLKAVFHNGLPWVEKYRPNDLSDLVSHQEIINTSNFIF